MSICRTYLKILAGHRIYILIYLGMLSVFALLIALPYAGSQTVFTAEAVKVAVVDHDGSALSRALRSRIEDGNVPVELADSDDAIQDALARDTVSYLLIIPEGWGEGLVQAAQAGSAAPDLSSAISYQSGQAHLIDLEATSYADALYGLAASGTTDQAELAASADKAWQDDAEVQMVSAEATPLSDGVIVAALFSSYSLFSSITIAISLLMDAIHKPAIEGRLLAAPTTRRARNRALFGTCAAVALIAWGVNVALQFVFLGTGALASSPVQLALVYLGMLVNALCAAGIGYLIGQFRIGENAANAFANVLGMVMSFLGGAWVSLPALPDGVRALAHFTPTYWVSEATGAAQTLTEVDAHALMPIFQDLGVAALFACAIALAGMALAARRAEGGIQA